MQMRLPRILSVAIYALGAGGGALIGYGSGLLYELGFTRQIAKEAITPVVWSGVTCIILAVALLVFGVITFRKKD